MAHGDCTADGPGVESGTWSLMGSLLYIRLIGDTAGALPPLFWMGVILGYRRQRNFERGFFFLCLALFFFYCGSLLLPHARIYCYTPPPAVEHISNSIH